MECKHIHAIKFWVKLKNKVDVENFDIEKELKENTCVYCQSDKIFKRGKRKTKTGT